jgi:hypothetical protein
MVKIFRDIVLFPMVRIRLVKSTVPMIDWLGTCFKPVAGNPHAERGNGSRWKVTGRHEAFEDLAMRLYPG